ncbi:methylation-associated defense system restriction endonuclease subunit S MAD5 [Micromonospora craniellae]|uniref:Restriction endonuclease subunit S n=1 Tax=Micromonospora craniellae TaxID=2294034 RepID=A0A372FRE8_9ACTN|nr:restriction endonuclease subunit S [Micromonospora craniellae]QOC93925.1 restriction endonuclease subunit S [Micromonospora craniellae]RFS43311.1 restriction endonuclease subunit S [Micromonospora craniellae]
MKVTSLDNPVKVDWFFEQGCRLDPAPYLSGALEARKRLEALPNTVRLDCVTAGHSGGIFNGPKFSRIYLNDPGHSVPFLGSTDMLEADFSYLPRLSRDIATALPYLEVEPGMSLISCSGTIGRMAYVRPDMAGFWSSQHVMKVQADPDKIPSGYLYTFLRSGFGIPMIVSSAYGAIIQHIEPHHLVDLPVPRFDADLEQRIHDLVAEAADLRAAFQAGLHAATEDFFRSVGLPDLIDYRWHAQEPDLGFVVNGVSPATLRAINYRPRAQRLLDQLQSVPGTTLGEVCEGGMLRTGARFKRVDAGREHGVRLVGQRQAFWTRPEGRWISAAAAPADILQDDETILVAAHGTFGENEVYSRSVLVTGSALANAYSQDFVRVVSGIAEVPGAYLFALFRTNVLFRIFRSISVGGKQQEYHTQLLRALPVPLAPASDRARIAETVRQAYRDRDRADVLEDEALALLTQAIEEAEA